MSSDSEEKNWADRLEERYGFMMLGTESGVYAILPLLIILSAYVGGVVWLWSSFGKQVGIVSLVLFTVGLYKSKKVLYNFLSGAMVVQAVIVSLIFWLGLAALLLYLVYLFFYWFFS